MENKRYNAMHAILAISRIALQKRGRLHLRRASVKQDHCRRVAQNRTPVQLPLHLQQSRVLPMRRTVFVNQRRPHTFVKILAVKATHCQPVILNKRFAQIERRVPPRMCRSVMANDIGERLRKSASVAAWQSFTGAVALACQPVAMISSSVAAENKSSIIALSALQRPGRLRLMQAIQQRIDRLGRPRASQ